MAIKALSQITEMPLKFKSSQAADNTTPPTPEGLVWSHIQGSPALFWSMLSCGAHGTFGQMWDLQLDVGLGPGLGSARLRCSAPETCMRVKSMPMQGKEGAAGPGKHGSKCHSSFQTPYPHWGSQSKQDKPPLRLFGPRLCDIPAVVFLSPKGWCPPAALSGPQEDQLRGVRACSPG